MSARVAVLMYHRVEGQGSGDRFLNVPTPVFRRQVAVLRRLGFHGVTLEQVSRAFAGEGKLPRRAVCFTFDDGYASVGENAAPILAEVGWPATVFVPSAYAGGVNAWDEGSGKPVRPIMHWVRLRELAAVGWEIAGHTRTHVHLADLPDEQALAEIAGGRGEIADATGTAPQTFCYPFGNLNERTPDMVRQAGFRCACTTVSGSAVRGSDPFRMPRVKIACRDGVPGLLYRLLIRPYLP